MALENRQPALACGRTVARVWQGLDRPPDAHTLECRECWQTRSRLQPLHAATAALREHDLRHPAFRPPRSLKGKVLASAGSRRPGGRHLQVAGSLDDTGISESALAAVVRDAARGVGGVRARRCRIDLVPDGGRGLRIHLRTAVAPGVDICRAMDFLRRNIRAAVAESVGIVPHTVHLTVEDLYDD